MLHWLLELVLLMFERFPPAVPTKYFSRRSSVILGRRKTALYRSYYIDDAGFFDRSSPRSSMWPTSLRTGRFYQERFDVYRGVFWRGNRIKKFLSSLNTFAPYILNCVPEGHLDLARRYKLSPVDPSGAWMCIYIYQGFSCFALHHLAKSKCPSGTQFKM